MAHDRPTDTRLADVGAACEGCAFYADTRNALALAARHHDATGHVITVELTRIITYGDRDQARRDSGQLPLVP